MGDDYSNLISVLADIREKSGVGAKPMLGELADKSQERVGLNAQVCALKLSIESL